MVLMDHISSPDSLSRFRLVVRKHPGVCLLHLDTLFFLLTAAHFIYFLLDVSRLWFLLVQAAGPLLVTEQLVLQDLLVHINVFLWGFWREKEAFSYSSRKFHFKMT